MIRLTYYQRNKERWKKYRQQGNFNLNKRKQWMYEYNKQYRQNHKEYYKEYSNRNWSKYYYDNHEFIKEYRRKKSIEYRRAKGKLPKELLRGKLHPNWKGGQRKCIDCGSPTKNRRKLGLRCFSCNRKYLSGKHHPMWTGGHTSFRKSLYSTLQYKQWRETVFKRDNYICQICFRKGGNLEAHHKRRMVLFIKDIIPNPKILKGWQVRNILLKYEPLWNIDNGITLCIECHNKEKTRDKQKIKEII